MPSRFLASTALLGMSAWMSTGLLIFRLLSPAMIIISETSAGKLLKQSVFLVLLNSCISM